MRQTFWTTFGQYISPQLSADGVKVNWINYKTGIKHVYFKMDAGSNYASIGIELSHPDAGIRELHFEQLAELKIVFEDTMHEQWLWQPAYTDEYGKSISVINTKITGVSVFNRDDWPELISFFKPRLIALDEFWSVAKYSFEALQ